MPIGTVVARYGDERCVALAREVASALQGMQEVLTGVDQSTLTPTVRKALRAGQDAARAFSKVRAALGA